MEPNQHVQNPEDSNVYCNLNKQPKPTHNSIINNEEEKGADVEISNFPQELFQGSGKSKEQQKKEKEVEFDEFISHNQILESFENFQLSDDPQAEIIPYCEQEDPIYDHLVPLQISEAISKKTNKEQRKTMQWQFMFLERKIRDIYNNLKYNFIVFNESECLRGNANLLNDIEEIDRQIQWETEIGKYKLVYFKTKDKKKKHSLSLESFPVEISVCLGNKKEDSIAVEKRIIYDLICHFCSSQSKILEKLEPHRVDKICQETDCELICHCAIKICIQEILLQQVQIGLSFSTEIESKSQYNKKRLQHLKLNFLLFQQLILTDLSPFTRQKYLISGRLTKFGVLAQIYTNLQLLIDEKKAEKPFEEVILYGCPDCLHVMSKMIYGKSIKIFEQLQPQDIQIIDQKDAVNIDSSIGKSNCFLENNYIDLEDLKDSWESYESILYQQFEKEIKNKRL